MATDLLTLTERGLYCPAGDFYVDPWQPVPRAVITHGHADHARPGSEQYLGARAGELILRTRLGQSARIDTLPYGDSVLHNGVRVSLHPAGHVLGSAQVRIEHAGQVWVVSGDYKLEPDVTCAPFEPLRCHVFVSESTFGLPIYRWPAPADVFDAINAWWRGNQEAGKASLLYGYALGKAQRLLAGLDPAIGPIYLHGAVVRLVNDYRASGVMLPPCGYVGEAPAGTRWDRALIVAPPSAHGTPWTRKFGPASSALASGWMRIRGTRRRRAVDRGFVLSDHADWPGLLEAIKATGAERVWVTHGYVAVLVRHLRESGVEAVGLETRFEGERDDAPEEEGGGHTMKAFADLYSALDETTRTTVKVQAMADYFRKAEPADAAWALFFLSGRKLRQVVPTRKLASWAIESAGIAEWLFEECYHAVGDLAEAIALLLPAPVASSDRPLHEWVEQVLVPLRGADEAVQREAILATWSALDGPQRFVWNKAITGALRVGVSQQLLTRALAQVSGLETTVVAHRLMGAWEPTPDFYRALIAPEEGAEDASRPYPFFLAAPLEGEPAELGPASDWQAEWKWDGIRSQLIRRRGQVFLWSRGEELITERYPELAELGGRLPDGTVIDGEVLPWRDGVLPFAQLQRRIGRKTLGKKLLAEVPVVLMAYDLLEAEGKDLREVPLRQRRATLERLAQAVASPQLLLSPLVVGPSWEELARQRQSSRERFVEGLMLKRLESPYRVGRVRGDWWKWKITPLTIDAVLIYAQRGSGKRASLYTDYTFGVWDQGELVPVAKAYSGLTDDEIRQVDAFVRKNTVEKFGPVRSVTPELVFELAFEGIQRSTRHKSGIAVRFPRILRWRTDKKASDADTIERVRALLPA